MVFHFSHLCLPSPNISFSSAKNHNSLFKYFHPIPIKHFTLYDCTFVNTNITVVSRSFESFNKMFPFGRSVQCYHSLSVKRWRAQRQHCQSPTLKLSPRGPSGTSLMTKTSLMSLLPVTTVN